MNTGTFRSSIDWSHELLNSTVWVLVAFAITAPCLIVVLVLIGRTTEWGRQFWRITGPYFTGRQSLVVWVMLALLLVSTIIAVRITVLISYYTNDVFTSLQVALQGIATGESEVTDSGIHGFWVTIGIFLILAVVHVILNLADMYLMQRFIMRWRIWLSGRLIDDWLGDFAYYRRQFFRHPNDNPDQRIQQDIDIFTTGVGGQPNNPAYGSGHTLLFGAVAAVLSVIAFGAILWQLSGALTLGGITLPRALFWIVIAYVLAATVIAFVIGRPLIQLSYLNELRNAGFRYALVRVRDASAAIGLYRGENVERRLLGGRLVRGDVELRQLAEPHGAVHRLEPDGEPGDQPVALRRAGAAALRTRDLLRRRHPVGDRVRHDPQRAVVLSRGLRRVRELPRGGDPPRRACRGERARPQVQPGDDGKHRRRHAWRSTASRCELPTARICFGRLTSASNRVTRCWSAGRPGSARPF